MKPDDLRYERVPLSTTLWNYFRPVYPIKQVRIGCLLVPILLILIFVGGSDYMFPAILVTLVVQILVIWSQRGAFVTHAAIHFRGGLLGLHSTTIPLEQVDDVAVDPVPLFGAALGDLGDITVRAGRRYLSFECISNSRAVARELLLRRDRARRRERDTRP